MNTNCLEKEINLFKIEFEYVKARLDLLENHFNEMIKNLNESKECQNSTNIQKTSLADLHERNN